MADLPRPDVSTARVDRRASTAARENAEWCHTFCASHGVTGSFGASVWRSSRRTPRFYPDAVTLDPAATAEEVLTGIDLSPGASVKDSFSTLDLTGAGFCQLFTARWLWREPQTPLVETEDREAAHPWRQIVDLEGLRAWERSWNGDSPAAGFFPQALLRRGDVELHAAYDGAEVVAGAVLHRSATAVGISNVFDHTGDLRTTWAGCARQAQAAAGGRSLVGYEQGEELTAALGAGFEQVGSLTVWLLGAAPAQEEVVRRDEV